MGKRNKGDKKKIKKFLEKIKIKKEKRCLMRENRKEITAKSFVMFGNRRDHTGLMICFFVRFSVVVVDFILQNKDIIISSLRKNPSDCV